jgi:deazaflavin-dependent oxidoreductase (nitroreductase family)
MSTKPRIHDERQKNTRQEGHQLAMHRMGVSISDMKRPELHFVQPGPVARAVNRLYGRLASLGLGPASSFLLLTKGRETGATRSTPVNVLRYRGKLYLVGTRGHTQWSRNAAAAGAVTLNRGRTSRRFRVQVVHEEEKPEILKAYVTRFSWMARRFFPVPAESPARSFAAIAPRYPVFELLPEM